MDTLEKGIVVSDDVLDLGLKADFFVMKGLKNEEGSEGLESYKKELFVRLISVYSQPGFVENDPILAGFRKLHDKVGRSNKKNVASPENLVKYFLAKASLPVISPIVDIYNCVSLESRLAIGAHDLTKISGKVNLRLTNGAEKFLPLGSPSDELKKIQTGEYGYIDDGNDVLCQLECRQAQKTKIMKETSDCFYIVQGNENTPAEYISKFRDELIRLTRQYCGGTETILRVS